MKRQPGYPEYWQVMPWPLDKNAPNWEPMPQDFVSRLPFFRQWPVDPNAPAPALHECVTRLRPGHYLVDPEKWDGVKPIPLWMIIPELMDNYRFHEIVPFCVTFKTMNNESTTQNH